MEPAGDFQGLNLGAGKSPAGNSEEHQKNAPKNAGFRAKTADFCRFRLGF